MDAKEEDKAAEQQPVPTHDQPQVDSQADNTESFGERVRARSKEDQERGASKELTEKPSSNMAPLRMPYYHDLKEIQTKVQQDYPLFPMQLHQDFLDHNYESVIKKAAAQVNFLFAKTKMGMTFLEPSNNGGETSFNDEHLKSQIASLEGSLAKSDQMIKNLRRENEYYQKQLDLMRRERETVDNDAYRPRTTISHQRSISIEGTIVEPTPNKMPEMAPHPHPYQLHRSSLSPHYEAMAAPVPLHQTELQVQDRNMPVNASKSAFSGRKQTASLGRSTCRLADEEALENCEVTRSLKFDNQQQLEMLNIKNETIRNLTAQLDAQKRRLTIDASKQQTELESELRELRALTTEQKTTLASSEATANELRKQLDELLQARAVDLTFLVNRPKEPEQVVEEKENRKNSRSNNARRNPHQKNLRFAMDINKEMEMMLAEHGDRDYSPIDPKPFKKKGSKKRVNFESQPPSQVVGNLILPENMLLNQIQAAQLAEQLIDELKLQETSNKAGVDNLDNHCRSLQVHSKTLHEQKESLTSQLNQLTKDNDSLKAKFSALLDQFQEYVTTQENKQLCDQEKQKVQQDNLLQSMQENIKELEQVTEGLQSELVHKETIFERLKTENEQLEFKLREKELENHDMVTRSVNTLEEEIQYLKKHHQIELNLLKEQLERSMENNAAILSAADRQAQQKILAEQRETLRQSHQQALQQAQNRAGGHSSHTSMQMSQKFQPISTPQVTASYDSRGAGCQFSPAPGQTGQPSTNRVKEIISTTQNTFDNLKKDLASRELVIEEKNKEILKLKVQNEELASRTRINDSRSKAFAQTHVFGALDPEQRRLVIRDLVSLIDSMRIEITKVRRVLYNQNGSSIMIQEPSSIAGPGSAIGTEEIFQSELKIQMQELRGLLAHIGEIHQIAQQRGDNLRQARGSTSCIGEDMSRSSQPTLEPTNIITGPNPHVQGGQPASQNSGSESNYQIKRNADALLRTNQASPLHELLLQQITRSEALMQDNALLQRSIYKYETTLGELDNVLRNERRDDTIFDFKRLVESQLKQIILLSREGEALRSVLPPGTNVPQVNQSGLNQTVNDMTLIGKKEHDQMKYNVNELQAGNEELLAERNNLVQVAENLEDQVKDSHRQLEEALDRITVFERNVDDKVREIEDIRQRVTKVAELFERKQIGQKYSFEVLCDFIHDKAKRLYNKYETVSKEKKVMQEEQKHYYARKVDQLESENVMMKEATRTSDRIIQELVPRLGDLLERPLHRHVDTSEFYYARQVLEMVEVEFRTLKKGHAVLKERNNELIRQTEVFKSELSRRPPAALLASPSPDSKLQQQQSDIDFKLMQARLQEQEEISRSQRCHSRDRSPVMSHKSFREDTSKSPLRSGIPRKQHTAVSQKLERAKSMERDEKN